MLWDIACKFSNHRLGSFGSSCSHFGALARSNSVHSLLSQIWPSIRHCETPPPGLLDLIWECVIALSILSGYVAIIISIDAEEHSAVSSQTMELILLCLLVCSFSDPVSCCHTQWGQVSHSIGWVEVARSCGEDARRGVHSADRKKAHVRRLSRCETSIAVPLCVRFPLISCRRLLVLPVLDHPCSSLPASPRGVPAVKPCSPRSVHVIHVFPLSDGLSSSHTRPPTSVERRYDRRGDSRMSTGAVGVASVRLLPPLVAPDHRRMRHCAASLEKLNGCAR